MTLLSFRTKNKGLLLYLFSDNREMFLFGRKNLCSSWYKAVASKNSNILNMGEMTLH